MNQELEIVILKAKASALTAVVISMAQLIHKLSPGQNKEMWEAIEKLQYAGEEEIQKHEQTGK